MKKGPVFDSQCIADRPMYLYFCSAPESACNSLSRVFLDVDKTEEEEEEEEEEEGQE